ncbi:MAG: hypothetical protein M3O71_12505 [Bacteroidota bacterium]|nr:hypothetical protein [Bacteroidota bacterium]
MKRKTEKTFTIAQAREHSKKLIRDFASKDNRAAQPGSDLSSSPKKINHHPKTKPTPLIVIK